MSKERFRALVVDDDAEFHTIFEYQFSNLLTIDAESNEEQARQKIQHNQYDIILIDLNLDPSNKGKLEGFNLISLSLIHI